MPIAYDMDLARDIYMLLNDVASAQPAAWPGLVALTTAVAQFGQSGRLGDEWAAMYDRMAPGILMGFMAGVQFERRHSMRMGLGVIEVVTDEDEQDGE